MAGQPVSVSPRSVAPASKQSASQTGSEHRDTADFGALFGGGYGVGRWQKQLKQATV